MKIIRDFIKTYIIEELKAFVNVVNAETGEYIRNYETTIIPTIGSHILLGWPNQKEHEVVKVVYSGAFVATVYVK